MLNGVQKGWSMAKNGERWKMRYVFPFSFLPFFSSFSLNTKRSTRLWKDKHIMYGKPADVSQSADTEVPLQSFRPRQLHYVAQRGLVTATAGGWEWEKEKTLQIYTQDGASLLGTNCAYTQWAELMQTRLDSAICAAKFTQRRIWVLTKIKRSLAYTTVLNEGISYVFSYKKNKWAGSLCHKQ